MSQSPTPRMRRPSWRDPRLGVGVLLVVASVALGSWVVSRADATVDVYQARTVLTPGETVAAEDLQVVQVRLEEVGATYLVPGADLADGAVVVRTVDTGELVPLSALGSADDVDVRPVQIAMSAAMQEAVGEGSRVDLWAAMPEPGATTGTMQPPELLVSAVEVASVHADTSVFAGSDTVQVQVLVTEQDLAAVLAAITAEAQITVVPRPGAG